MNKYLILFIILLLSAVNAGAEPEKVLMTHPLIAAVKSKTPDTLRQMLKQTPIAQVSITAQYAALVTAIDTRNVPAIRELRRWGVDANGIVTIHEAQDSFSLTPLAYATTERAGLPVIQALVEGGASVNPDQGDFYPLHAALSLRDYDVAAFLLKRGARADAHGPIARLTPLMEWALSVKESDDPSAYALMEQLVKSGADVNARAAQGTTALRFAVMGNKLKATELLLRHGADPTPVSAQGETALAIARRNGFSAVEAVLLKAGASR